MKPEPRFDCDESEILDTHHAPRDIHDRIAPRVVKTMRLFADAFFSKRYGHCAVALETVAAVPGIVGGLLRQLKSVRHTGVRSDM